MFGRLFTRVLLFGLASLITHGGGLGAMPAFGASPAVFPIYVSCGERTESNGDSAVYRTRIEITLLRTTGENGEIIVSPDIVAGEINPGETVVLDCSDLVIDGESAFGYVNVQVYPNEAFRVRVTYHVD